MVNCCDIDVTQKVPSRSELRRFANRRAVPLAKCSPMFGGRDAHICVSYMSSVVASIASECVPRGVHNMSAAADGHSYYMRLMAGARSRRRMCRPCLRSRTYACITMVQVFFALSLSLLITGE